MGSTKEDISPNLSTKCDSRLVLEEKDEIDFAPNNFHVRTWELFLLTFSIFSYIIDVFFDMNLAINYYKKDEITYATLTLLFVFIPSFITISVSLRWYCMDEEGEVSKQQSRACWCFRFTIMMLQLAPVLRYWDSLRHAWQCRLAEKKGDTVKQHRFYRLMLKEDADAALLRVFECFLEAAPQLVLQMTIIMIQTVGKSPSELISGISLGQAPQALSIITSLVSIAWSMASYQRSTRFAQDHKQNLSIAGSMLQFTWHMLIAVSRILSFSAMASVFSLYTGLIAVCHWILMALWLMIWRRPVGCEGHSYLWTVALSWVLGLVYLFVYISTREGRTRNFYLLYYAVFFFENLGMLSLFGSYYTGVQKPWYFILVLVGASVSFFAGIITMLVYYGWFHPTTDKILDTSYREKTVKPADICRSENIPNSQELTEIDLNGDLEEGKNQENMNNVDVK